MDDSTRASAQPIWRYCSRRPLMFRRIGQWRSRHLGAGAARFRDIALGFALSFVSAGGAISAAADTAQCASGQTEIWLALPATDVVITGVFGNAVLPGHLQGGRLLFCGASDTTVEAALALPGSLDAAASTLAQLLPPVALEDLLARVDRYLCPASSEDLGLPAPARDYVRELGNRWSVDEVRTRAPEWPGDYLRSTSASLPSTEQHNLVIIAVLRLLRERSVGRDITLGCQVQGALPKARRSGGTATSPAHSGD